MSFGWGPAGVGRIKPLSVFDDERGGALWLADEGIAVALGAGIDAWTDSGPNDEDAAQGTADLRPLYGREPYGGVRNLFNQSESIHNAAWTKTAATTSAAAGTTPSGANADSATYSSTVGRVAQTVTASASATLTLRCIVKKGTGTAFDWVRFQAFSGSDGFRSWFNLSTGALGSEAALGSGTNAGAGSITSLGDGWYELKITGVAVGTSVECWLLTSNANSGVNAVAGSQLLASELYVAPETSFAGYQKRVSALDVTESGKRSLYYAKHDLSNDVMAVTLPDLGSSATTFTASEDGVEVEVNQTISGSYTLPEKNKLIAHAVFEGGLTPDQWAGVMRDFCHRAGHYCSGSVDFLA